ncbi:DUF3631 domain-containing protein [Gemmatimonas sp.]|uniref:DUF3631 domain-containing protein n=1 Tax=Gemmatimonas sp. TaxID=1962908 RepID=UPI0022C37EC4|nr:DUF3631 domain-containing protein [Gemmatimonas sp.]MCZ8205243.1 DUF3631 domain-containing protein [Gemmatimonas sp.]
MSNGTLVAEYPYRAADGTVLATKQRYAPKDFRWTIPLPTGGTASGLNGLKQSDLPLFRLPELLAAPLDTPVLLVEGEKDALTLAGLGFVATTLPEGAGVKHIPLARLEVLRHRRVYIFADNDAAGRAFRDRLAEALGTVVSWLYAPDLPDLPPKGDVTDWVNAGGTADELCAIMDAAAPCGGNGEDTPDPIPDGAQLADEVMAAIRRFVVMSDHAICASALWCLHTWAFEASENYTPYLAISSPEPGCGKTTVIDVLATLAADPKRADSATPAAIYRMVDRGRGAGKPDGRPPTLFLDELDTVFRGAAARSERAEALRGVLNSGFKRDGIFTICQGDDHEVRDYHTWCPKLLAGIGELPPTVAERSIPLRLSKATDEERVHIESARSRTLAQLEPIKRKLAAWAQDATPRLKARPEPFAGLSARQDDIWGPLLNIADDCGGAWPQRAREAARVLHAKTGNSMDSVAPTVALLSDLRDIFAEDRATFIPSARLAELLRLMEDRPWPEYTRGGPISPRGIAVLLGVYGIHPRVSTTLMADGRRGRGYYLDDCREAFRRYLPPPDGETVHPFIGGTPPYENAVNTLTNGTPSRPVRELTIAPFDEAAVPLAAAGYPADW